MRLSSIASKLDARLIGGDGSFCHLSTDSRNIASGSLFVALRGEHFDGHEFVSTAVAKGACAVVVDIEQKELEIPQLVVEDTVIALGIIASEKRQDYTGKVVAITGSSGKTTVKGMLNSILENHASTIATDGNFNNHIGVPLTLMRLENQTYAVVELGTSHPGEIAYLTGLIDPDISLVTNVLPAHIGGFGNLSAIAEEKSKVYFASNASHSVINLDEPFAEYFIEQSKAENIITYSLAERSHGDFPLVFANNLSWVQNGKASFNLCFGNESVSVRLKVPGEHNVSNALAASACAIACGLSLSQIVIGLENYTGTKGRMQEKLGFNQSNVIDDTYNANPGSVCAAIDSMTRYPGKKIFVFGDMGELGAESDRYHKEVGVYAAEKGIDLFFACGPMASLAAEVFGVNGYSFLNKNSLVDAMKPHLDINTTVLVKGSRSAKMDEVVVKICSNVEAAIC